MTREKVKNREVGFVKREASGSPGPCLGVGISGRPDFTLLVDPECRVRESAAALL